jgi:hypothetical protein
MPATLARMNPNPEAGRVQFVPIRTMRGPADFRG